MGLDLYACVIFINLFYTVIQLYILKFFIANRVTSGNKWHNGHQREKRAKLSTYMKFKDQLGSLFILYSECVMGGGALERRSSHIYK